VFVGLTNATIPVLALYQQQLVAKDTDIPVQPLTFKWVGGPAGSGVTNGVFSWTPSKAKRFSTNNVAVVVSDGVVSVNQTFTIIVTDVSGPTIAQNPSGAGDATDMRISKSAVRDPNAPPVLGLAQPRVSLAEGRLGLILEGNIGARYRLEVTTDFIHWNLVELITLTETPHEIGLPLPPVGSGRFYRMLAQ
jgi:hypothetical protein